MTKFEIRMLWMEKFMEATGLEPGQLLLIALGAVALYYFVSWRLGK